MNKREFEVDCHKIKDLIVTLKGLLNLRANNNCSNWSRMECSWKKATLFDPLRKQETWRSSSRLGNLNCTQTERGLWTTLAMSYVQTQPMRVTDTKHRNTRSKSWLAHLVWPLLCGWKPEERLTLAPSNFLQNFEKNWGPLSEIMSVGHKCKRRDQ